MPELKPCPFCGGEPIVFTQYGKYGLFAFIECATCEGRSKTAKSKYEVDDEKFWESLAYSTIKNAWNRRVEDGI